MNSFKRKALTCAVLAGLGGIATTAEAVYRNPDGTGMVLIYPYYTVNSSNGNAFNTYISVTNTTSVAKVTKVRFREGRTSAEVLDFNLYLSPNDVWVGDRGGGYWEEFDRVPDTSKVRNFGWPCYEGGMDAQGDPYNRIRPKSEEAGTSPKIGVVQAGGSSAGSSVRRRNTAICSRVTGSFGQ